MLEESNLKVETLPTAEKKNDKSNIVELKNGRVNFKQKPMSLEKLSETLQEIVRFREMVEERMRKQEQPLQTIPDDYLPLVAKLGHESDKTLITLAKYMQQELIPPQEEEEGDKNATAKSILPIPTLEQAIKAVLSRNNYGLEIPDGGKLPAAVCVWRWEVKEDYRDWLPKSVRDKVDNRLSERIQAKENLKDIFNSLTQSEKDAILDPKGTNRIAAKDNNKIDIVEQASTEKTSGLPKTSIKQGQDGENQHTNSSNEKSSKAKKAKDPERATKGKERQEKRAAKAEKEKRAKDSVNKSRTIMANFFSKPKPKPSPLKSRKTDTNEGLSHTDNDFERAFKPFVLKKGSVLAPENWFTTWKKRKGKRAARSGNTGIIVIDSDAESERGDDDVEMQVNPQPTQDITLMTAQERLKNILASMPPSLDYSRFPRSGRRGPDSQYKTYHPYPVRDLMAKLTEAEVAGDDSEVRVLSRQLEDRTLYPVKVLIYHEDARPGYYGTWTRNSRFIGPRTPFAKDVIELDYGYDSGAEWEEEPAGDADDVMEDDEEDGESDEADSDLDSWLVDDDDEPETLHKDIRDLSPPLLPDLPSISPPPKRKASDIEKKAQKKRKVVIPLVPFAKGPCWESIIGDCEYGPFDQYRIQTFNDTPFPIDPFTFVSTCVEDFKASLKIPALPPNGDACFAVPSLPEHVSIPSSTAGSNTITNTTKKSMPTLKYPFPEDHLPFLLSKITELQMASLVVLVETIYQELKAHKVKKNAIEAKIREVGEKCKEKKIWIVKPAVKVHT